MGAAVLLGCAAIALGPAAALLLLTVAAEPLLLVLLVAGAFFWLLSLLAASLLWSVWVRLSGREDAALLPLGAAGAVLLQELCRFACFKVLKKADEGLATLSEDGRSPISLRRMAYVSGLSFGIISGVFSITNILADSVGPGTVGIHGDSQYYFITSGEARAVTWRRRRRKALVLRLCVSPHSLPHHGPGTAPHLLGHHLLRCLRATPRRGPGAGGGQPPAHLRADLPEPMVRGQPGPHLHPHALHWPLGLQHRWWLLPQRPQVPLL